MQGLIELLRFDRYLGFDLVAAGCGLAGMYLLGSRSRAGFLLCALASAFGIGFAALAGSLPLLLMNTILSFVNIWGFLNWGRARVA
jgi:hypothetical protein